MHIECDFLLKKKKKILYIYIFGRKSIARGGIEGKGEGDFALTLEPIMELDLMIKFMT